MTYPVSYPLMSPRVYEPTQADPKHECLRSACGCLHLDPSTTKVVQFKRWAILIKRKNINAFSCAVNFAPSVCVVLNGGPELDLGMGDNNKIIISGHVIFYLLFFWGEGGGLGLATRRVFQKYFLYIGVYS